jgi:hypothetical protein
MSADGPLGVSPILVGLLLNRREQHLVFQCCVDAIEQFFFAEGFDEVTSNPGIERALTDGVVGKP